MMCFLFTPEPVIPQSREKKLEYSPLLPKFNAQFGTLIFSEVSKVSVSK